MWRYTLRVRSRWVGQLRVGLIAHVRPIAWAVGSACFVSAPYQLPVGAQAQEVTLVAATDFVIGGRAVDAAHQFGDVQDLAMFPDHRFLVADGLLRRVALFTGSGQFIADVGRPGEGPGEFESAPRSVAVSPNEQIWVKMPSSFQVFSPVPEGWSYAKTVRAGPRRLVRGKPAFAVDGSIGLRIPGVHGSVVWVTEETVVREDTLPSAIPFDEMGYREFFAETRDGRPIRLEARGPFHPKDLLRLARTGGYARALTSRYVIDLFGDDGSHLATISQRYVGPQVTRLERQREEHILDSLSTYYKRRGWTYPTFEVPERKPPIENLWYDEDNRLWVQISTTASDTLAKAHVYTKLGEFLFVAAWPRDVSLEHGAIRGRTAIGVRMGVFDVPEIVRMSFNARRPREFQLPASLAGME